MDDATDPAFATLLDLVGRRWTLRLIWELRRGPLAFNELRKRAGGLSQSVLVTRLTELFGAGLVADVAGGYQLTARGASLAGELAHLDEWARRT
jgi:DNA-binding HxlR family transcriptional regulator